MKCAKHFAVVECGEPPALAHAIVEHTATTYTSVASYQCVHGYTLWYELHGFVQTIDNGNRTCESEGHWSNETYLCEPTSECFILLTNLSLFSML